MLKDVTEGEGDLTQRLDDSRGNEVAVACGWFNVFIGKLQGNIDQVASPPSSSPRRRRRLRPAPGRLPPRPTASPPAARRWQRRRPTWPRNRQDAARDADHASAAAQAGAQLVGRTVAVMSRIAERVQASAHTVGSLGERGDQIGAIIGTIEDIADQTNLLALNAAIEAARTGGQGRGFAVVADQVHVLAERTTRATREIGTMIEAIQTDTKGAVAAMEEGVREVENGAAEAARSGEALSEILGRINAVTVQVNQVAAAAKEQTATRATFPAPSNRSPK